MLSISFLYVVVRFLYAVTRFLYVFWIFFFHRATVGKESKESEESASRIINEQVEFSKLGSKILELAIDEINNKSSTAADLKSYLKIQKLVIYQVLQWFQLYNKLYNQIIVNQIFLNSWADNFISSDLENSIIQNQDNSKKHENYIIDIEIENCKNNLQEAFDD